MIVFGTFSVLVAIIYFERLYAFCDAAFSLESRRVNDKKSIAHDNNIRRMFLFDVWHAILCLCFVVVRTVCNNICIQTQQVTKRYKKTFLTNS